MSIPRGGPKHDCTRMAGPYATGKLAFYSLVAAGLLKGEETQRRGTAEGAKEAAPHFCQLLMYLGPKGPACRFCLYCLVCKVTYANRGLLVRPKLPRGTQDLGVLA